MFRLRSRLFGDFMVSMPFVNYGGALAGSEDVVRALMEQACHRANELGVEHIEFRDMENRSSWYPVRTDKVIMERVLPKSDEDLWLSFDTKLRAQVKRAAKESVEVVWGGDELLPLFYRVFSRNMRDLGTPVYGRGFFQAVLAAFPNSARVIVVNFRNEAAAAALLLGHRERIEIPWASSIRDYNRYGVNMLMYWEALRMATREGYRVFDFGRSTLDSGTFRFKKQWGAKPVPLYWHYWLREGCAMPQLTPNSPKFRVAVRIWQRLPLFVTTFLGPGIVKNLP
jgi:FemAB-related protein (PEP-CTERM system-associated)